MLYICPHWAHVRSHSGQSRSENEDQDIWFPDNRFEFGMVIELASRVDCYHNADLFGIEDYPSLSYIHILRLRSIVVTSMPHIRTSAMQEQFIPSLMSGVGKCHEQKRLKLDSFVD
jgi:hypothetical protein